MRLPPTMTAGLLLATNLVILLLCSALLPGCGKGKERSGRGSTVVVAIEGDVDYLNPLFAEEITAGEINDLLFPSLTIADFDATQGLLEQKPWLAKAWEFENHDLSLRFHLVANVRWSDGAPVTARDVQLSYELYADTAVASVRQSSVQHLRKTGVVLDVGKSVQVVDDSTVVFHFERAYAGQLFDASLPILPAHVLEKIPRQELRTHPSTRNPIPAGPFKLGTWNPLQEISLVSNDLSRLPNPALLARLAFRILPEYRSRIAELEAGSVDLASGLTVEDAHRLAQNANIEVVSSPGRDLDFIGWNNIDPQSYAASGERKIRPHRLFGSAAIRNALTRAINRDQVTKAYLGEHGQVAFGGVSPLFTWAFDTLTPLPYDPQKAAALLAQEGWKDTDGDGILDKAGVRFSFTLKVPMGNQLRSTIATVVQQQLREIQIDMKIEQVERSTFWKEVTSRTYDAWLAGFSVPLQMQLDDLWGSDLERYPFNLVGYRNKRVDEILATTKTFRREIEGAHLWKEFQGIIHRDQPYTFLFWINNLVAVNKRVQGTHVSAVGTLHRAWEWHVAEAGGPGR